MPVKLKWPWLGIAIPCFLISFIGYGGHYFIFSNFLPRSKQRLHQCNLCFLWLSYYLAIKTNPGLPKEGYEPLKHEWKNYCKKCQNYKPPRAHHCKTCNQCVLMMDHHCPWTMNCVGFMNFPHFLRFIIWVIIATAFSLYYYVGRIIFFWTHRNLPDYMFHSSELVFLTILTPLDSFVLLTMLILFGRCLGNQIFGGMSQIESWELDRLHALHDSERLLPLLLESTLEIFPELDERFTKRENDELLAARGLKFDAVVNFPYDINPWVNAVQLLGSPLLWLWPYGKGAGDGVSFQKNDIAEYSPAGSPEDILLSLPWPPDGGRSIARLRGSSSSIESVAREGEQLVRRKPINTSDVVGRNRWLNDWGENLQDFGVDVDTEQSR